MFTQFFWKVVLCVAPVLASLWVVWDAYANDRFKRGVDLSGGTILVYEIDTRKQLSEGKEGFDPKRDTNLLAESLKRRIDPNDLKNIIIRPAGGEGRVEIVLPTGGTHRAKIAAEKWNALLDQVQQEFKLANRIEVGRGRSLELAERVQLAKVEDLWRKKLFNDQPAWKRLLDKAVFGENSNRPELESPELDKDGTIKKKFEALRDDKTAVGDLRRLDDLLSKELERIN